MFSEAAIEVIIFITSPGKISWDGFEFRYLIAMTVALVFVIALGVLAGFISELAGTGVLVLNFYVVSTGTFPDKNAGMM